MRRSIGGAFSAAVVFALAACGGGGGGGGGGALLPIGVVQAPAPTPAPPAPPAVAEVSVAVEVGGSPATPDGSGKYIVVPGQQVVVKAEENVAWLGSAQGSGVTRTDVDTSATRWVSRFANPGTTDGSYKLVADASGGRTKEVNFVVRTGDYRNGDYMVYAANGSRQTLSIDFDKKTYEVTDAAGDKTSGSFNPSGTRWGFLSSRITGINNATFVTLKDNIVGAFPFAVPYSAPVTYSAAPFVATRAFVLTQAKLDGTYDRARIEISATGRESAIAQIQISGGGTVMKQCTDLVIYRVEHCPAASLATSSIEPDPVAGQWILKNPVSGATIGRFAIADVEGDKVYLSGGFTPASNSQILAIGVPAAASYPAFNAYGWATDNSVILSFVSDTQYVVSPTSPTLQTIMQLSSLNSDGPPGIRGAINGADVYFVMRSSKIDLLIGARSQPVTRGFLHIGVIE